MEGEQRAQSLMKTEGKRPGLREVGRFRQVAALDSFAEEALPVPPAGQRGKSPTGSGASFLGSSGRVGEPKSPCGTAVCPLACAPPAGETPQAFYCGCPFPKAPPQVTPPLGQESLYLRSLDTPDLTCSLRGQACPLRLGTWLPDQHPLPCPRPDRRASLTVQ